MVRSVVGARRTFAPRLRQALLVAACVLTAVAAHAVGPTTGNVNGARELLFTKLFECKQPEDDALLVVRDQVLTEPIAAGLVQSLGGARDCLRELEDLVLTQLGSGAIAPDTGGESALKEIRTAIKLDGKAIQALLTADAAALARESFRKKRLAQLRLAVAAKSIARFHLQQLTTTRASVATHDAYHADVAPDSYVLGFETREEGKPTKKLGWSSNLSDLKFKRTSDGTVTGNDVLAFFGKKRNTPGTGGFDIKRPLTPPFDAEVTIGFPSTTPAAIAVLNDGFACLQIFDAAAPSTFSFVTCARPFDAPEGVQVFTIVNGASLGQTFIPALVPVDLRIEASVGTIQAFAKPRGADPSTFTAVGPTSAAIGGVSELYAAIGANGLPKAKDVGWWFDDLAIVAATR